MILPPGLGQKEASIRFKELIQKIRDSKKGWKFDQLFGGLARLSKPMKLIKACVQSWHSGQGMTVSKSMVFSVNQGCLE